MAGVARGHCGGVVIVLSKEVQEVVRLQEQKLDPLEDREGRESHRQLPVWLLELLLVVVYGGPFRQAT